jgi:hypothetical protein
MSWLKVTGVASQKLIEEVGMWGGPLDRVGLFPPSEKAGPSD